MTGRRQFLAGMLAAGLAPRPGWADAGLPSYLAAGRTPSGQYKLCGLSDAGDIVFALDLPDRGHAATAHPYLPQAVAFARRPGVFALVLDCRTGAELARLTAPEGQHFYGHGVFSKDGETLFTTENAYENAEGRIGIWDAAQGFARIGSIASNGIGPHEILRLPGSDTLVVANGGIETHPDSGRAKLNLPMMAPNLSYLTADGAVLDVYEPDRSEALNSIRHLAVDSSGQVAMAMQWQGELERAPALLALHRQGEGARTCQFAPPMHQQMKGYAGSVAFSGDAQRVAITSPVGGEVQVFDATSGAPVSRQALVDTCGLAPATTGLMLTAGTGEVARLGAKGLRPLHRAELSWDNHLVPVRQHRA